MRRSQCIQVAHFYGADRGGGALCGFLGQDICIFMDGGARTGFLWLVCAEGNCLFLPCLMTTYVPNYTVHVH